jgi:hypothetical protein
MANENVKIVIKEDNQTSPRGAGASSDIAYVPGLAVSTALYKNRPVLCNSVAEFEQYFGKVPYEMTDVDVNNTQYVHTYQVGDYDKSYIYAKELINNGLSVIYENIVVEDGAENLAKVMLKRGSTAVTDNNDNSFTYECIPVTAEDEAETIVLSFDLKGQDPTSGSVTVLFDGATDIFTLASIVPSEEVTGLTIDNTKHTVSWAGLGSNAFSWLTFNVTVAAKYVGTETNKKSTFTINVVETAKVGQDVVAGSKIQYLYDELVERLKMLEDKNEFQVKYITSGGYPTFMPVKDKDGKDTYPLADSLIATAYNRGDAVALVDHMDDPAAPLRYNDRDAQGAPKSIYAKVNDWFKSGATNSFGAMFTPWADYSCVTVTDVDRMMQSMPASFGYLMSLAVAIKSSPNWLAIAGVARGSVPNLKELNTNAILTNVIAEDYQPKWGAEGNQVSVNAITNIKPYGLTIWGNRTLEPVAEKGTTALNFLNTRNMISDIKKLAYSTAKSLMFEQDSDTLWLRFKSGISPLLDQLKGGFGISNYKIIRGTTKYNGDPLTRGEMAAVIKIYPLYAIEYFEITVVVADEDVAVS